jgi:hypothetical protein
MPLTREFRCSRSALARALLLRSAYPYMASPPTCTLSSSTSSGINANTGGTCSHPVGNAGLNFGLDGIALYSGSLYSTQSITNSDSSKVGGGQGRIRFMTDEPAFEIAWGYAQGANYNLIVDGEVAYSEQPVVLPIWSGARYLKFDFGADTESYELISASTPTAGGTGYVIGDVITLAGGTTSDAASVVVVAATSGVVNSVKVKHPGVYSVRPTGAIAQGSTTGSGTGFTITSVVWGNAATTRRMRKIEFVWNGGFRLYGVNVAGKGTVRAWPAPATNPRVVFVGDSQSAGTYLKHGASIMPGLIAQRLGIADSYAINAQGGTGWNQANGTAPAWSHANRIADIVALAPDIVVFIGSQNDTANAALQTAVTDTLNSLLAALPSCLFVGIGPVIGDSTLTRTPYLLAGWAAANDQTRVRYIDNWTTNPWINGTGYATGETGTGNRDIMVASDGQHLDDDGLKFFAHVASQHIADAVLAMAV